jgi:hypothetical protein
MLKCAASVMISLSPQNAAGYAHPMHPRHLLLTVGLIAGCLPSGSLQLPPRNRPCRFSPRHNRGHRAKEPLTRQNVLTFSSDQKLNDDLSYLK